MFRIGIAGYDLWPHTLAFIEALEGAGFCEIASVWDEDPEELELLVKHTGARGYGDLREFARSKIDGGILTVRTSERARVCAELARAGKHVLADKPMAMSVRDCGEMIEVCREHGVTLFCGYNFRYWPTFLLMKSIWDRGGLGEPRQIYCSYPGGIPARREDDPCLDNWWTRREYTPGGGWFTHGDHAVDFARWIWGCEIDEVTADMRTLVHRGFDVEDYGVAHFLLDNGATLLVHADSISPGAQGRLELSVYGTGGGMSYSTRPKAGLRVWGDGPPAAHGVAYEVSDAGHEWHEAMREMVRAWVRAAEDGAPPEIAGIDGLRVMEACLAAYESSREANRIQVRRVGHERRA